MNLQSIIVTNCIGFTMLVVLLISSSIVRQRRTHIDRLFTALTTITAISCIVEMLTFIIDGQSFPGIRPLSILCNSWLYAANILLSFLWAVYTDLHLYRDTERIRKRYRLIGLPMLTGILMLIPNIWMGTLFSLDEQNRYHRELGGYLFYLPMLFYLVYSVVLRYHCFRVHGRNEFFPIWLFIVPVLLGATAQTVIFGISTGWCSVAIGLVGMWMGQQNEMSYLDPLTRLYNRNYLDQFLRNTQKTHKPVGGMMIDLDDFKQINDRFGHSVGDAALVDTANILRSAAGSRTVVIRFAGDEFIVLEKTDAPGALEAAERRIREELARFNAESGKPYRLGFSIGLSTFRCDADTPADTFLSEMDERMYAEKRRKHSVNPAPVQM
ncbi:MAG: GGDEF domain-containing protein [Oscillospiraceae bacterium]|nr:GGDEF domain-containing protein [Oscillospiraceae bacterium]